MLPVVENLFSVCNLNLDLLNAELQAFISDKEPLNTSPTTKLEDFEIVKYIISI